MFIILGAYLEFTRRILEDLDIVPGVYRFQRFFWISKVAMYTKP